MGPPSLLLNGHRGSFPGLKRPGRYVDHSSVFSAEVKNGWSYNSASRTRLHGVETTPFSAYIIFQKALIIYTAVRTYHSQALWVPRSPSENASNTNPTLTRSKLAEAITPVTYSGGSTLCRDADHSYCSIQCFSSNRPLAVGTLP
jgi:hypothetical protein